jgi:K+-transporting ATPase A subunit
VTNTAILVEKRNLRIFTQHFSLATLLETKPTAANNNQQHEYDLTMVRRNLQFGTNAETLFTAEATKKATAAAAELRHNMVVSFYTADTMQNCEDTGSSDLSHDFQMRTLNGQNRARMCALILCDVSD